MAVAQVEVAAPIAIGRPTKVLPWGQLVNLSSYWLGITAIWAGLGATMVSRMDEWFGVGNAGLALGLLMLAGVVMPIAVQPTMGMISDFTTSRWGRRKPYIAVGGVLDVIFLYGIASSQTYLSLLAFYVLLQFSSNLAQGPFQGYMPDLVPEPQVARASGVMGFMIVAGQVTGTLIATSGLVVLKDLPPSQALYLPTIGLGLLELATAAVVLLRVDNGPRGRSKDGRSWGSIARLAWGRDVLQQRSFLWFVGSRLCFLAATGMILSYALLFLQYTLGMSTAEAAWNENIALAAIVIPTAITVVPAARLSDRFGRKTLIYAACLLAGIGLTGTALAPSFAPAVAALVLVGIGTGAFLAVDWALMTDIIPKASPGRYMGMSNVGTALAGPVGVIVGGIVLFLVSGISEASAPRAIFLVAVPFFVLSAALLRQVDPTPQA